MCIYFFTIFFLNRGLCLHYDGSFYNGKLFEELSKTDGQIPFGLYYTWDPDDNESNEEGYEAYLGHGDLYIYNLMFLSILPPLSSIITKIFVTIGYIIAVQIGYEATRQFDRLYGRSGFPGVPLPVIMISIYAVILDVFIEY